MITDSSILDSLTPEAAAELRAATLRDKAEKDRLAAQEADRVREKVFKSRLGSIKMFTTLGTPIVFVNHLHITNIPEVIEYLEGQIKRGLKDIYIDREEVFFDPDKYDPEKKAYKQARADVEREYAERLAAVTNPGRDMGNSTPEKLTPASTTTIAAVAAGSGPAPSGLANRLNMLKVGK